VDLRRFNHHRQFLKFCGLDLSTQQSGQFRGATKRYLRRDPASADRKRMAYVAVAAKMARVAHGIIKTGTDFRCFYEAAAPKWKSRFTWAVEAVRTS
jgi:hypothetical protein